MSTERQAPHLLAPPPQQFQQQGWGPVPTNNRLAMRAATGIALLTRKVVFLGMVLGLGQAFMPDPFKPATIIGGLYGAMEKNEIIAKQQAVVDFTRKQAESQAQPPAIAQEDVATNQKQLDAVEKGMETEQSVANWADLACIAGSLIPRDSKDYGDLGEGLRGGCGVGTAVRGHMADELAQTSRNNSALIRRGRPAADGSLLK